MRTSRGVAIAAVDLGHVAEVDGVLERQVLHGCHVDAAFLLAEHAVAGLAILGDDFAVGTDVLAVVAAEAAVEVVSGRCYWDESASSPSSQGRSCCDRCSAVRRWRREFPAACCWRARDISFRRNSSTAWRCPAWRRRWCRSWPVRAATACCFRNGRETSRRLASSELSTDRSGGT